MGSDFKAALDANRAKKAAKRAGGGGSGGLPFGIQRPRTEREAIPKAHKSDPQFHVETKYDWRGRPKSSLLQVRQSWWRRNDPVDSRRVFAHMEEHEGVDPRQREFHQGAERARGHAEETEAILASEPKRWQLGQRLDRALRARDARGAARLLGQPEPEGLPPPVRQQLADARAARQARRATRGQPQMPEGGASPSGTFINGVPIEQWAAQQGRRGDSGRPWRRRR